jgi:membrane protein DedA with SNARE-associated domain
LDTIAGLIELLTSEWTQELERGGFWLIFLLMAIESSVLPLPSEMVMLPAGLLAAQGKLNFWTSVLAGTTGSLAGALVNYALAIYLGRPFLLRYGKYFLMPADKLLWVERYWTQHGEISTFVGRLLPVVRHLISLPAGVARMNLGRFCWFTTLGAAIWVWILTATGYWLGDRALEVWKTHKHMISLGLILACGALVALYLVRHHFKQQRLAAQGGGSSLSGLANPTGNET